MLPPSGPWRPRCEGRPGPGALPPPAAILLGAVGARCPRAVGTGVRVRGPALSPWPVFPVFLRSGQPRFRGPRVRCEGRLWPGAPPPQTVRPLWGLRAAGVAGDRPRGGWPATVAGGVWCQALFLSLPPVLWGGQPGFRDPCVPAAVGAGVVTQHRPHSVCPCGPALLAVGVAEGRPRGGCLPSLRGASEVTRSPSPDCPPSGRAVGVRYPRVVGAGVWVWGPDTVSLACTPCGGCVPWGCWGAVPGGGWPATVVRGVWCQALSLPRPPVLWGGQPGFRDPCVPGAVGAGVGTQHRPHSVHPCGPALLAVGVAEG